VPAAYFDAATRNQAEGARPWPPRVEYDYLWWVLPGQGGAAANQTAHGFGGQYIWVMSAFDAVLVVTAHPVESNDTSAIVFNFVVPAFTVP